MIYNIAGYKFIYLEELKNLREDLFKLCNKLTLKGTILLSHEGININLSGHQINIEAFINVVHADQKFKQIHFHKTFSDSFIFKRLKVKIKKEIITLRKPETNVLAHRAPTISSQTLKKWLDENQHFSLLDARNGYEIRFGTFSKATHLSLSDFSQFPKALDQLTDNKPIVMFCTGGIRCEKAALFLLQQHPSREVYQLEGGILGYFKEVGGAHYKGECFVFDNRISLDTNLNETGTKQCIACQGPITKESLNKNPPCPVCI